MNLLFKNLSLENFGSFAGIHTFQFARKPGLYFVSGRNLSEPSLTSNGVGKSTLFNALFWGITGKTLRLPRPGASIESWYSTQTVKVSVELEIDNVHYLITRTRKPNSLTLNGQAGDQQVISDLLKLSEEGLKRTILVGQFVPMFLDLKPEAQSNLFTEALNLDLWLHASEKASEKHKAFESKAGKLEVSKASLNGRLSQLKEQYTLDSTREENFDIEKRRKYSDAMQSLAAATQIFKVAEVAFKRAARPGSIPGVPGTSQDVPLAARVREREFARAESDILANLRSWQREAELTKANLARYQATKNFCPECNQVVEHDHIKQKVTELVKHSRILDNNIKKAKLDHHNLAIEINNLRNELIKAEEQQQKDQEAYIEQNNHYIDLRRQLDRASAKVTEIERELDRAKNMANPYTDSCEQLATTYFEIEKQIKAIDAELNETHEQSSIYKYWTAAYKEIRLNLIDDTLQELEIAANRHIQSLGLIDWQIAFKTERENKSGTISHSFSTVIYPNGQDKPISFESYSGGESQRLQLAVTAALSEILLDHAGVSTNIEILDEPSRSLSQEGITDLLECLKERATDLNRCIYFIDHNSLESGYFDKVITIEKTQEGSRILE